MADEAAAGTTPPPAAGSVVRPGWMLALVVVLVVLVLLRESFFSMAELWHSSSTFSYGFLIAPVSLFLLWRERAKLAEARPEPAWPAVALMIPAGLVWILGVTLEINLVNHVAAVSLLILAVWAVVGTRILRIIWFPLAYLFFMVPFGEFLVPTLMRWTADFAVVAVSASGVPVFQDGFVFSLPSGDFEVIKACSGIRFLMATLAAGVVFAWVAYQSWRKRLLFLAACLVVPIVGNLVRAWLVVMMVHLSDGRLAGAHVLLGTIFYAAILVALFVVGARHADTPSSTARPAAQKPPAAPFRAVMLVPVALATVVLAILIGTAPAALRHRMATAGFTGLPHFPEAPGSYSGPDTAAADWHPVMQLPAGERAVRYHGADGARAMDVYVAVFDPARRAGELGESGNRLFDPKVWRRVGGHAVAGRDEAILRPVPGGPLPVTSSRIVWSWYVVNGVATSSRLKTKLLELQGVMTGRTPQQVQVALSTPFEMTANDVGLADARRNLLAFGQAFCAASTLACPAPLREQPL